MGHYWAKFEEIDGHLFRLDTRVYLTDIDYPTDSDNCIGAIVGKNPGSAKPREFEPGNLFTEIKLDGDKLLPTVKNIIQKSMNTTDGIQYVQVLNLFYLCNKDLHQAINSNKLFESPILCPSESKYFPWVWFVWGGSNFHLNKYKERFATLNSQKLFFYNKNQKEVIDRFPAHNDLAKHTQGLPHGEIVPYFKKMLNNELK